MTTLAPSLPDTAARPRDLPERLLAPLHLVSSRARLLAFLLALFQSLTTITLTWLFFTLLLGSLRAIPVGLAILFAFFAWLSICSSVLFFRSALRRQDPLHTARLIDHALPDTHERISSALELSQDHDPRYQGSPELIAVLLRQAEHAAERLDPAAIISGKHVFRWFLGLIPILAVWFVLFVVITPTITLGLQRLLQPYRAAAALPTAKLDVDPGNVTIAQGDRITINLAVTPVGSDALSPDKPVPPASLARRFSAGNANEELTAEMERTGNRSFRTILDNVQQSFSYHLIEGDAHSPSYTVTVLPRPAADSVQIDYTYPAYTHRPAHSETTRQGSIDALVGTTVRLTLAPNQALKSATLTITDNAPDPSLLTLSPLPNNHYAAEFIIKKSTDYRLHLFNAQDLENADTQPRSIIARLDTPPQITIASPTDPALKVRPDDTVPIKYSATDDFGLTKIELITQVDARPPTMTPLPLDGNTTTASGALNLALHTLVADPSIQRIAYTFRATDNRAPEAQVGLSSKQVLIIDRGVAPLAARQDAQAARTLAEAIRAAAANVNDAKTKLDTLRKTAATRPLTDAEKQQAADARRDLANASQALQSAADKSTDSRLAPAAAQAKAIADSSLRRAQENTAASQLAADQPDARNQSLDAASQNLTDAQKQLADLGRSVNDHAKDQPLAHELERIANEQRRLADALAQNPNDPQLLAQQRQLQQDLEKVIKDHPELQKPAAQAASAQAADLQKQLEDLRNAQKPLNDQAQSQTDAAHIQDKLADLSKQQEELNKKIDQFNQQQANNLRSANSKTPDTAPLKSVSKDLQDQKLASAAQSQNAAATQLEETARQLENADKRDKAPDAPSAGPSPKDATALQQKAQDLQQQITDAQKNHNPPTRPSDPANQEATKLADQVHHEAQQVAQNPGSTSAARQAAQQAAAEAESAKREAAQGNASAAQQHLATATSSLQQAASNNAPSTPAGPPPQQSPSQAAAQARQLAQEQRNLAEQTSQANKSLDNAATSQEKAPQTAQQQQQLAGKMEQAAKTARELQQKTQGSAPEMSQRAGQTAQALEKAAAAQRAAAQAPASSPSQSAQSQQQSAQSLASAQQTMSSQNASSQNANGQPASGQSGQPGQGSSPSQSSPTAQAVQSARDAQSQAASGNPAAARQAADQLSQASQQLLSGQSTSPSTSTPSTPGASGGAGQSTAQAPAAPSQHLPSTPSGDATASTPLSKIKNPPSPTPSTPLPKDVETLGVSPSDWARLPATSQDQLLHAAQQSGPPAYRDMIKNYYSRIAHLDDQGQGGNP